MERLPAKGVRKSYVMTQRGNREKTFIDVKNLFRLVGRSSMPKAEKFMDWVYDDVLPSIMKTGSYTAPGAQGHEQLILSPEEKVAFMIRMAGR